MNRDDIYRSITDKMIEYINQGHSQEGALSRAVAAHRREAQQKADALDRALDAAADEVRKDHARNAA